jgi:hypothetical protein
MFAAAILVLFLNRLWQPELQVQKHSTHLIEALAAKDWAKFGALIANEYQDQWGNDRAAVLERTREIFRSASGLRITAVSSEVTIQDRTGYWRATILIDGDDDNDVIRAAKSRVNTLATPFELDWRRVSGKPWDWKLVGVRNPDLTLPSDY